jgi:hypothetical protein
MTELHLISLVSDDYDDGLYRQPVCAVFGEEQAKQVIAEKVSRRKCMKIVLAENLAFYEQFITDNLPEYYNIEEPVRDHARYNELTWKQQWNSATLTESEQAEIDLYIKQRKDSQQVYQDAYRHWIDTVWKPAYFQFCAQQGRDIEAEKATFCEQTSMGQDMEEEGFYEISVINLEGEIPAELLAKL